MKKISTIIGLVILAILVFFLIPDGLYRDRQKIKENEKKRKDLDKQILEHDENKEVIESEIKNVDSTIEELEKEREDIRKTNGSSKKIDSEKFLKDFIKKNMGN